MKGSLECPCCGLPMSNSLNLILQELERSIREIEGISYELEINSGTRCERHNLAVNGERNSAHLKGLAVDIKIKNSHERYLVLKIAMNNFKRIGIGKSFVHLDIASGCVPKPLETNVKEYPQEVMWLYT